MRRSSAGAWAVGALLIVLFAALPAWLVWRRRQAAARVRDEQAAGNALLILAKFECDFMEQDLDHNGIRDYWICDVSRFLAEMHVATVSLNVPMHPLWDEIYQADLRGASKPTSYGYLFVAMDADAQGRPYREGDRKRFGFCAHPADGGRSGRAALLIDDRRRVYRVSAGEGPVLRFPSEAVPAWPVRDR